MKSIIVDIDEKDLKDLGISNEHISFDELRKKLLVQSIKKQREELEKIIQKYGWDKLAEEEIFDEVNKAKEAYYREKKNNNC